MTESSRGISHGPRITQEEASCFETIPEVPVYRPTESEFSEFVECMAKIEQMGAHHMGLCKIIPPPSYRPRKAGYKNVNFTIEKPIVQVCSGVDGIYLQDVRAHRSMSFKQYDKFSSSARHRSPPHSSVDELEAIYWSSIARLTPLYGANVAGSLTDAEGVDACDIPHLRSLLSEVLAQQEVEIGGVNTPYLYAGAWATTFAWHVEDMDLYSINYLHFGAPKLWYCIPPAFARRFEAFAREHFKSEFLACRSFLRHKSILIDPRILAAAGIPTRRILQHEGEIMCTFPYGYHAGFNTGVNCAESTNFALPRWLEYGKQASVCCCWDDTVRIDMAPFVRRLEPEGFEAWQRGERNSPHPLELYKPRGGTRRTPRRDLEAVLEAGDVDLNVRGLFHSRKALNEASLPYYLRRNPRLKALWSGFEWNFETIVHFNELIASEEPFCAVCAFLWSPLVTRKALCGPRKPSPPQQQPSLPTASDTYLSEVVFCRSSDDFAHIQLHTDTASRLVQCRRCRVAVHTSCYGLTGFELGPSGDKADGATNDWLCEPCASGDEEPQCVLCPMRGGALKALANASADGHSSRPFWVHLGCAIAVGPQNCRFIDVPRRVPLLLPRVLRRPTPFFKHSPSPPPPVQRGIGSDRFSAAKSLIKSSRFAYDEEPPIRSHQQYKSPQLKPNPIITTSSGSGSNRFLREALTSPRVIQRDSSSDGDDKIEVVTISSGSDSEDNSVVIVSNQRSRQRQPQRRRRIRPPVWKSKDYYLPSVKRRRSLESSTTASTSDSDVSTSAAPPPPPPPPNSKKSPGSGLKPRCEECGLPAGGGAYLELPLVSCWHDNCPSRYHLTCAQFGGTLIATSQYPHYFYLACQRHPNEYREFEHDEEAAPLHPGDMVYALDSNSGRYYKAVAMAKAGPQLCHLVFLDGTFSRNTPANYITDHDWERLGAPKVGSEVKVKWTDGLEYPAVFQGASVEKWNVRFPNKQVHKVRRDKIFRLKERIPPHIRRLISHM